MSPGINFCCYFWPANTSESVGRALLHFLHRSPTSLELLQAANRQQSLCSHACSCVRMEACARMCPDSGDAACCSKCTHFTAHEYSNGSPAGVAWKQQRAHLPSSLSECCLANWRTGPGALVLPDRALILKKTLRLNRVDFKQLWLQPGLFVLWFSHG